MLCGRVIRIYCEFAALLLKLCCADNQSKNDSYSLAGPPGIIIRLPPTFDDFFVAPSLDLLPLSTYTMSDLRSLPHPIDNHTFVFLSMFLGGDYASTILPTTTATPYPQVTDTLLDALTRLSRIEYTIPSSFDSLSSTSPLPTSTTFSISQALLTISYSQTIEMRTHLLSNWSKFTLSQLKLLDPALSITLPLTSKWPSVLALSLYLSPKITPLAELLQTGGPQFPDKPDIGRIVESYLDLLGLLPEEIVGEFEKEDGVWRGIVGAFLRREGRRRERNRWFQFMFGIEEEGIEWRLSRENGGGEDAGFGRISIPMGLWVCELKEVLRIAVHTLVQIGEGWEGSREFEFQKELVEFALGKEIGKVEGKKNVEQGGVPGRSQKRRREKQPVSSIPRRSVSMFTVRC